MTTRRTGSRPSPLFPARTALIMLLALVAAAVVGGLAWLARHNVAEAVLAATFALAGAVTFFDNHVGWIDGDSPAPGADRDEPGRRHRRRPPPRV